MAYRAPTQCCGMYHLYNLSTADNLTLEGLAVAGYLASGGLITATTNALEVALANKLQASGWKRLEVFGNPGHGGRAVTLWGLRHHQPAQPYPSPTDPCPVCVTRAERLQRRRDTARRKSLENPKKGTS